MLLWEAGFEFDAKRAAELRASSQHYIYVLIPLYMCRHTGFEFDAKRALELQLDARYSQMNLTLSPPAPALSSCRNWNEQFGVMKACKALKEYQIVTQVAAHVLQLDEGEQGAEGVPDYYAAVYYMSYCYIYTMNIHTKLVRQVEQTETPQLQQTEASPLQQTEATQLQQTVPHVAAAQEEVRRAQ
jgi:hypothetical protein